MDIARCLPLLAPALAGAAAWCVWRATTYLTDWTVFTARVVAHDYGESERADDRALMRARPHDPDDLLQSQEDRTREVAMVLAYTDAGGAERRVHAAKQLRRGRKPDSVWSLWVHRADPARVCLSGPAPWGLGALACLYGAGHVLWPMVA